MSATAVAKADARTFHVRWAVATMTAAAAVSAADALLLERSRGYFTGGFLSADYLQSGAHVAWFLSLSLLVDAALIGFVAAVAAWALGHTRLHARACVAAGVLVVTGVLLGADVLSYGIMRYLGDAFDFGLMFDLTGGSLAEMLAVSGTFLLQPLLVGAAVTAVAGAIVLVVHRRSASRPNVRPQSRVLALPAVLCVIGMLVLAGAAAASDTLENGLLRKPSGRAFAFVINTMSDVDGDGYGLVGRIVDMAPLNGAVFPYAPDIPGNGIDEDGVAGDLPQTPQHPEPIASSAGWQRRPDVVLFVLESFRADVVGLRQNGTAVTPVMEALAARGVSVRSAYSHNGYTVQSRHHLLSGSLSTASSRGSLIDDFKTNGYVVGYFSGQDESFGGAAYDVGFRRADVAFDARSDRARRYSTTTTPGSLAVPMMVVQERVEEFLRARGGDAAPIFLYVNFHDTHFPYWHEGVETLTAADRLPRERIGPQQRDALWRTYVNTAANVDRAIGRVLDRVRHARGKEPGIIVTADHGESLFDEGFLGHGYGLNDAQTRIPLVVANLPMPIPEPFGQTDLRHALAEAMRTPPEAPDRPSLRPIPDRLLFQYLGAISRPRQIASLQNGRRLIFDFRNRRVQDQDRWVRPADLTSPEREAFVRLIHYWESVNLTERGLNPIAEEARVY